MPRFPMRTALIAAALSLIGSSAFAAVYPSFLEVPGLQGGAKAEKFKGWVRVEANQWKAQPAGMMGRLGAAAGGQGAGAGANANGANANRARRRGFSPSGWPVPEGPREGASSVTISVDKTSPALTKLMDACAKKTKFAELTYAESSEGNRGPTKGPKPADVPDYYAYKLKDVTISDCPVVAGAPEQAFVMDFGDSRWLNFEGPGREIKFEPAKLKPIIATGETKSYVVQWIAYAHDVADGQCPTLSSKPEESAYFAYMTKDETAKEKAEMAAKKTNVNYENGQMEKRGPHRLNVCKLPGIVPDAGHAAPQTGVARGINLDGNDGAGAVSADTCKHKNYVSADGKQSGIDNQLFTVQGCTPAYMGHKGFYFQYSNEQRKNGMLSILLQVSGIDNEQNDDSVDVTILYSLDPMAKNAAGTEILPDYTFRLTDDAFFTSYATQLHGKIVNGVLTTEQVDDLHMNHGMDIEIELHKAALRLEFQPNGAVKGVIGGYIDWRQRMAVNMNSNQENLYGYKCPGLYQAFKRAADGLKDPITGECNGISAAYDIEAVPAFISPGPRKPQVAEADTAAKKQ